jgi:hypothetical protein
MEKLTDVYTEESIPEPGYINLNGSSCIKTWYKNGLRHREGDQPAVVHSSGRREWWVDGVLHRAGDLPAITEELTPPSVGSYTAWYSYGRLHRTGGQPAVIRTNSGGIYSREWWVHGVPTRERDLPIREEYDWVLYADGRKEYT